MAQNQFFPPHDAPHSDVEHIKRRSNYLRGSLTETLEDPITGSIPEDDNRLMKHHGSYMQDDRDLRNERLKQKLNPLINSCCGSVLLPVSLHRSSGS